MTIDTKALPSSEPKATVALIRRYIAESYEASRAGMTCGTPKAVRVDCAMVERLCRIAEKQADRLAALEGQLHLANIDALQTEAERNELASELRQAMDERDAAQAEARELRAELARVRELPAKWRAAPQNPDEPLLAIAADELDAAISRPAERHDPLAVSDHCGECGEPEPECACDERIEDYRPTAQESCDASG